MPWLVLVAVAVVSYLVGAIPFGYLVARMKGVDIFAHGSGNIGATNVGRVLGRKFGYAVFVLDFLKGALPVLTATFLARLLPDDWPSGLLEVVAGLSAFLGHLFPITLGFRGGKGVATGAGVVAVMLPIPTLAAFAIWLVLTASFRMVSLSSIAAALALVAGRIVQLGGIDASVLLDPRTLFSIVAATLVIVKHRSNVSRIWAGTENMVPESTMLVGLARGLHVLATGGWLGAGVFFSFVVALSLFQTFETIGQADVRPNWLPRSMMFEKIDDNLNGPKEQGSRVAGAAVGPIFPWYFAVQAALGFVALSTALGWRRADPGAKRHAVRVWIVGLAVLCVMAGWPVEEYVARLRPGRNDATDVYLRATSGTEANEALPAMRRARGAFGAWHGVSLLLNFATLGLVTAAVFLAGFPPDEKKKGKG